jgi:hypothetical protein
MIEGEGPRLARDSLRARLKILLRISCPRVILEQSEESRFFLFPRSAVERPDSQADLLPLDDLKTYVFQVSER